MNAPAEQHALPVAIGSPFGGGFFFGRFLLGSQAFALVVAPKGEGEHDETMLSRSRKDVPGAHSYFDGLTNTIALAESGSAIAKWARSLRIGGHDDWYLPSRAEALQIKGLEADAGPLFWKAGAERFEPDWYWTSTQSASDPDDAWVQTFGYGDQYTVWKNFLNRARAVRRIPL